ncbi:MAG: 5'/3'-nucleotidase SurE [Pseudomonadota bacterium]
MRVLLTNDDGIDAPGIALLERAARAISDDVWIVAPAGNQSSCSRAITQTRKVRCETRAEKKHAIEGTPGDCVIIALNGLLDPIPDVILSGVNRGSNLGEDIGLSGTVGACLQAAEQNVPAIAFSQVLANFSARETNWKSSEAYLSDCLQKWVPFVREEGGALNINFPPVDDIKDVRGYRIAPVGRRLLPIQVKSEKVADGVCEFDYRSLRNKTQLSPDGDVDLAYRGHITVTPLHAGLADDSRIAACNAHLNK